MIGLIIVDHGSKEEESNLAFLAIVARFHRSHADYMVEPAHMQHASPSLLDAFDLLVKRGAKKIIIHPYFLLPGRHWKEDIPRLCQEAHLKYPQVSWQLTQPLGEADQIIEVIAERVKETLG